MPLNSSPYLIESLYRISSLASGTTDPRKALETVLDEIRQATGATGGSIALIDPDSGLLRVEAHRGLPPGFSEQDFLKIGEGTAGWAVLHEEPLAIPDVSLDSRYRKVDENARSEMAVPLRNEDQVLGAVSVTSDRVNAFDDFALDSLVALASETAVLLRRLWRVQSLEAKARHLEAVLSVGQSIAARLDQREVLESITRQAVSLSGCRICAIHLLDDASESLITHASAGSITGIEHPPLPLEETSAGTAANLNRQLEVFDILRTEDRASFLGFAQAEKLASLLCTPMVFEGRVLGILSAYTGEPHRFSNDEQSLFRAMAGLGAVAIHNSRLYERVFQTEESLRQQEKLTALGLLAAEIAHEVRNPLTVLKLLFSSLNLSFAAEDPRSKDAEIIREKMNQLESTVGRVLAFARPSEEYADCKVDEIIADTLQLVRLKAEQAGVEVIWENCEAPPVRGDKGQLQQALLNLMLNSLRAVGSGGRIELRSGAEEIDGRDGAFIQIGDTGKGIPEKLRPDIFKTLLTGYPEGGGLGLGIVKRIVEGHNGQIKLVDTGPDGTVMKLWVPVEN